MVNEEVLGALRSALERGESLSRATKTLRNARYKKEDIDEAASIVSELNIQPVPQQKNGFPKFFQPKNSESIPTPSSPTQMPEAKQKKKLFQKLPQADKSQQKVSGYDDNKPKKKSKLVPILIFVLFFIAIAITTVFFFQKEISYFLSNLLK
jgi:hypothetical protein